MQVACAALASITAFHLCVLNISDLRGLGVILAEGPPISRPDEAIISRLVLVGRRVVALSPRLAGLPCILVTTPSAEQRQLTKSSASDCMRNSD